VPQGLLAAVSLTSGVALAVLSRRMGVDRHAQQWTAIRAMGWTSRDVARAHIAELAVSAVPGVILGLIISVAIVVAQAPDALVPALVSGAAAGALALVVVLVGAARPGSGR
jgi:hypothetical protein